MMGKKINTLDHEKISLDNLPDDLQMIAETLSIDIALKLSKNFGGMRIYIPKIEHVLRSNRNNHIRQEFNGANHKMLARNYKLTETQIRTILKNR